MKRTFTKYPSNYVKASTASSDYPEDMLAELYYKCFFDGEPCDRAIPNVVDGVEVPPCKYNQAFGNWELCRDCPRNHSVGGGNRGYLTFARK